MLKECNNVTSVDEIIDLMKCQPIEKQLECGERLHEIYAEQYKYMHKMWTYMVYVLGLVTFLLLVSVWWKLGAFK